MIVSLKAANGVFASVGQAQVQPVANGIGAAVKQAVTTPGHISAPTTPAHQVALNTPALSLSAASLKISTNLSIQSIATNLINNKSFVLPPFQGLINIIMPSFMLHLEPAVINRPVSDKLVVTTKKYEPYEQLTGIAHERPEIVMLTNFLPLFTKNAGASQQSFTNQVSNSGIYTNMTDAGEFVDTYLQARNLRQINVTQLLRSIRSRYSPIQNLFIDRRRSFESKVDALRDEANFLLELVRSLERLKSQLDLRDDIHVVDPSPVVNYHVLNFTRLNSSFGTNVLFDLVRRYMPVTYSIPDTLVRLGYKSDAVRHRFSSTKIWMQLMVEMSDMLKYHSSEFLDIDTVAQRNDINATRIIRKTNVHFGLAQKLPSLPPLSELSSLKPTQIHQAVSTLGQAWDVLYQDVNFKNREAQMSSLVNLVSKEFRYSYGMSQPEVQDSLRSAFNYVVQPSANVGVFESIVGKFGNNISDFPGLQTNSLANLAQRRIDNKSAVLTFESKYIDGDTGTLTPGGEYYVDSVLDGSNASGFNTTQLNEAGDLFEKAFNAFNVVVNGMNMLGVRTYDQYDKTHSQFTSLLSSPVDFIDLVTKNLINQKTGVTLPTALNDNLGAVYTLASNNPSVKSALFLYTIARITRSYLPVINIPFFNLNSLLNDNTPLTDALIKDIIAEIEKAVPQVLVTNQPQPASRLSSPGKASSTLTSATVTASLKQGTVLTKFIETTMQQVLASFRTNDAALNDDRTRYSGHLDTTIMMAVFDSIIYMVGRYNNQKLVSSNYIKGVLSFNLSKTTTNFKSSYNDLVTRMEKEVALNHKVIYTAMNSLQKLSGAFKNYSNYLNSPPAISKLNELVTVINNPDLVKMLMSEQQIMLLASTVHDLVDQLSQRGAYPDNGDVDGDGDFDADDELKILDDSVVSPKLRNAIYGTFGTDDFASKKGYNKKIITVGIPLGFTRRLKQRVSIGNLKKSTFIDKQNDIVSVVIYKVDLENSDIVYKPKRMLFELSRFPVRNDYHFLSIPDKPSFSDIAHAIPTRDFGQSQANASEITYWSLNTQDINNGRKAAFSDETYDFLSQQEKNSIINNHVMSYMLEVYAKLVTGIDLGDHHFDLVEQDKPVDAEFLKTVTEHYIAHTSNIFTSQAAANTQTQAPSGGVLFSSTAARKVGFTKNQTSAPNAASYPRLSNAAGTAGSISPSTQFSGIKASPVSQTVEAQQSIGTMSANLSALSHRNVPVMLHGLRTISNMSQMLTPLADPTAVTKRIVSPKMFDRVFNVIIDPDEFEIDYDKTTKTPHGVAALKQMILKGDVIPENENYFARNVVRAAVIDLSRNPLGRPFPQGRASPNQALFRFRDRDKGQGDLTFEKYFVTVETYGEEEV